MDRLTISDSYKKTTFDVMMIWGFLRQIDFDRKCDRRFSLPSNKRKRQFTMVALNSHVNVVEHDCVNNKCCILLRFDAETASGKYVSFNKT